VQLKSESSLFKKFKAYVGGSSNTKHQEQERGMRAMLPSWGREIQQGRSVHSLVDWVLQVMIRQMQCLSRFIEFTRENDHTRHREAKSTVYWVKH